MFQPDTIIIFIFAYFITGALIGWNGIKKVQEEIPNMPLTWLTMIIVAWISILFWPILVGAALIHSRITK